MLSRKRGNGMERISPQQLQSKSGSVVIDVREYPEFAAGAIPGASRVPLSSLQKKATDWDRQGSYQRGAQRLDRKKVVARCHLRYKLNSESWVI